MFLIARIYAVPESLFRYMEERFIVDIQDERIGKLSETGTVVIDPEEDAKYLRYFFTAKSSVPTMKLVLKCDEESFDDASDIMMQIASFFDGEYSVEDNCDIDRCLVTTVKAKPETIVEFLGGTLHLDVEKERDLIRVSSAVKAYLRYFSDGNKTRLVLSPEDTDSITFADDIMSEIAVEFDAVKERVSPAI